MHEHSAWIEEERMAKAAAYYGLALRWQLASGDEVRLWSEHVAMRTAGALPALVVDLLDAPNAGLRDLLSILAAHDGDGAANAWAPGIALGRLSLALRIGERSVPQAMAVLRIVSALPHPLAEAAEVHRHDYILATEPEVLEYDDVLLALRGWLAAFEEAAIEARFRVPLVWRPLPAPDG